MPNSPSHNTALNVLGPSPSPAFIASGTARVPVQQVLAAPQSNGAEAGRPTRSLYIHIPFCFHKCHYCDFYSFVDTQDRQAVFVDRLIAELAALAPLTRQTPLQTIFVGGGTPSLLAPPLWKRLLAALHDHYDCSLMGRQGEGRTAGEFTVECNPETVTPELMATLAAGGVNRVSVGAQSFHTQHLKTLERWHDPANVRKAIDLARAAGIPRQTIDLIYAIPGQTIDDWAMDVRAALDLNLSHVSCYNLTYEPNTAMAVRLRRGEFTPTDEDFEIEMFELAGHLLQAAGLARYEVSNYARSGEECRHNLAYWRQEHWLAAGPSASAHIGRDWWGGSRWKNVPRLDDYLRVNDQGFAPITDLETPDPSRALRERLMTGLRLSEGLPVHELRERTKLLGDSAENVWHRLERRAKRLTEQGQLDTNESRWRLTRAGLLLADGLASEFMACVKAT